MQVIRRPDPGVGGGGQPGVRPQTSLWNAVSSWWTVSLCSGSQLLEEKAAAAVLTVTPGLSHPSRAPECVHAQEREV